jgi:hypothetical protein
MFVVSQCQFSDLIWRNPKSFVCVFSHLQRGSSCAVPPGPAAAPEPGAMTARLRYQQTKIDGAPDTILIEAEIAYEPSPQVKPVSR